MKVPRSKRPESTSTEAIESHEISIHEHVRAGSGGMLLGWSLKQHSDAGPQQPAGARERARARAGRTLDVPEGVRRQRDAIGGRRERHGPTQNEAKKRACAPAIGGDGTCRS